jgi:hypothetical protein
MRGPQVYCTLPEDLPERMLQYVVHVLASLDLLYNDPGTSTDSVSLLCLGTPVYCSLPEDLSETMLNCVVGVLASLALL